MLSKRKKWENEESSFWHTYRFTIKMMDYGDFHFSFFYLLGDFVPRPSTKGLFLDPARDFRPQAITFVESKNNP